jgi:hypothetical protein
MDFHTGMAIRKCNWRFLGWHFSSIHYLHPSRGFLRLSALARNSLGYRRCWYCFRGKCLRCEDSSPLAERCLRHSCHGILCVHHSHLGQCTKGAVQACLVRIREFGKLVESFTFCNDWPIVWHLYTGRSGYSKNYTSPFSEIKRLSFHSRPHTWQRKSRMLLDQFRRR